MAAPAMTKRGLYVSFLLVLLLVCVLSALIFLPFALLHPEDNCEEKDDPKMRSATFVSLSMLASRAVVNCQTQDDQPKNAAAWVPGKAFDRFAVIWLENTDYDLAIGDPSLSWLAKKGITLSNYFAVTHPSMPNYAASISGDYYGCNHDDLIKIPSNVSTIVDLLEAKGISWGEYQEDMPSTGFEGFEYRNQKTGANAYVRKHNPAVLYDSVAKVPSRLSKTKNLTSFYQDLEADVLPQWFFVTPVSKSRVNSGAGPLRVVVLQNRNGLSKLV